MVESQKVTVGGCLCGAVRYEVKGSLRDVVNWDPFGQEATGIIAGSLDGPTGLKTIGHIFVAEKCDFYEITDGLPQYRQHAM